MGEKAHKDLTMKNHSTQIKQTSRTRIRISSHEKLTFWRASREIESDVVLECPFCGHEVFWVDVERKPDIEFYEETQYGKK